MNQSIATNDIKFGFNIPNIVTGIRLILALVIAYLLFTRAFLVAGILFIIAAFSDGLDGLLARRLRKVSLGGAIFDLVTDEILFIPNLIISIIVGRFSRVNDLMPLNPFLYAVPMLAGGVAVLAGVAIYLLKRRRRFIAFPRPTIVVKINFCFWLASLAVAIFGLGPDWLLAGLMYSAIISTVLAFCSYLKKGGYVFTD
jgi:phosphatidylglycerophosphate synthase